MKFSDYYREIEEIDPSSSREQNLKSLIAALRVWRKRHGDDSRIKESFINKAIDIFDNPRKHDEFHKWWEGKQGHGSKVSPEQEFRALVHGTAMDGVITLHEYQLLLKEAKRKGISKKDAERIIKRIADERGATIAEAEVQSPSKSYELELDELELDECLSCSKKFGWLRKRYYCDLCQEAFCKKCISQTTLSWGGSFSEPYGGLKYELVFDNDEVGYRGIVEYTLPKAYTLCKHCEAEMRRMIEIFKNEIRKKLDSIIVTADDYVTGYKVVRRFGFIEYSSHPSIAPSRDPFHIKARSFLKNTALKLGANALINYQVTYIKRLNTPPPPHPPKLPRDPRNYVPGYVEGKYQEYYQHQQSTYTQIPIDKAEAVIIQKIKN